MNTLRILLSFVGGSPVALTWPCWARASASPSMMPRQEPSATASDGAEVTLHLGSCSPVVQLYLRTPSSTDLPYTVRTHRQTCCTPPYVPPTAVPSYVIWTGSLVLAFRPLLTKRTKLYQTVGY